MGDFLKVAVHAPKAGQSSIAICMQIAARGPMNRSEATLKAVLSLGRGVEGGGLCSSTLIGEGDLTVSGSLALRWNSLRSSGRRLGCLLFDLLRKSMQTPKTMLSASSDCDF